MLSKASRLFKKRVVTRMSTKEKPIGDVSFKTSFSRKFYVAVPEDMPEDVQKAKLATKKQEIEYRWKNRAIAKPLLNDVVKIELLANEVKADIEKIWKEYHRSKYCVASSMSRDQFLAIKTKTSEYPQFVVPLSRTDGAVEFFYWQQQNNIWLYTPLIEYQRHGDKAESALTVAFYQELMNAKDVVLMRGEINPACLDILESQFLLNQIQINYLDENRYTTIVRKFHEDSQNFDFNCLLDDVTIPKKKTTPE